MALLKPAWSTDLFGRLSARGYTGPKLMDFTDAIAGGSVTHVVGKPFATVDSGTTPGSGVGTGVGITGIVPATVAAAILAAATAGFGQAGPDLPNICDDISQSLFAQMGLAALSSTHTPVYLGTGIITPGSIPVVGAVWGTQVQAEGSGVGFIGDKWPAFADAIGSGCATGFATATGAVAITGSPTGPPVPGSGAGVGVIS